MTSVSSPGAARDIVQDWLGVLSRMPEVKRQWGQSPQLELLCARKAVHDDPLKILIRGRDSVSQGVAKCSIAPQDTAVQADHEGILQAKNALSSELGSAVVAPLDYQEMDLGAVMLLPYHPALTSGRIRHRLDCMRFQRPVLRWLAGSLMHTQSDVTDGQRDQLFRNSLRGFSDDPSMPSDLRAECALALARLEKRTWRPKTCLMHGDFWAGNILKNRSRERHWPFVIIDWGGSQVTGYPFVDLFRVSQSLRVSRMSLRQHCLNHCDILRCDFSEMRAYFLSYFGWLHENLNEFPVDRYRELVKQTFLQVDRIVPPLQKLT